MNSPKSNLLNINSKMAKINNLFAEKFNKDVKKEIIQENKNLKNNVPKSEKSVY